MREQSVKRLPFIQHRKYFCVPLNTHKKVFVPIVLGYPFSEIGLGGSGRERVEGPTIHQSTKSQTENTV